MNNRNTETITRKLYHVLILAICFTILPLHVTAKKKELNEMSVNELEKEWKKGNADACYRLAEMYLYGLNGTKQDMQLAIMRCGNAVDMGHPGAQLLIGMMFEEGIEHYVVKYESMALGYYKEVLKNPKTSSYPEGSLWKLKAADRMGLIHYGNAMSTGDDVKQKKEFDESLKYLKIAEEELNRWQGEEDLKKQHAKEIYQHLANTCLMKSIFCEENLYADELHYRKLGADLGDEGAKFGYANTLYKGNVGIKPDKEKAIPILLDLYENSSDNSIRIESLALLATDYYEKKDYSKALKAFEELLKEPDLTDEFHCFALMKLAAMYRFGRGVPADEAKANSLTEEASKLGDPDAQEIRKVLRK